jgi:uncharacterized protein with beta-barrel porin domain
MYGFSSLFRRSFFLLSRWVSSGERMGLLKNNNFSVRLLAIPLSSIFLIVGSAKQVIAANGLNEVANGNTVTATTIGGAGATLSGGLIESNETGSINIIIDSDTGVVTIGNNITPSDSFTLTESSGNTTQGISVTTSGTTNGVVFADDLVVSSTANTNSLTITATNDNITFQGNATTSGGGTNSIAIVGGTGTSTLSLTFDTVNIENIVFDASITASNALDTITMNVNNSQGGTNTIAFSQNIGATAAVDILNIGANTTATFNGTVDADAINISSTNTTTFNGGVTGAIDFAANGTISVADGVNITGAITNTTTNQGTLNVAGTSTFSGDVGSTGVGLNAINIQGSGKTVTFSGDLKATTTTISNLATLKFSKAATTVTGSLTAAGTSGTIDVGTSTVTASGTVTFGASAKLGVTIGTTNGQLVATGGATLASGTTIVPTVSGSLTSGTAIVILIDDDGDIGLGAGVVSGITVTDNNSQYNFTLALNGNNLELTATAVTTDMSSNATAVNEVVDVAFANDSTLSSALNGLAGSSEEGTALESLAPVVDGGSVIGAVLAGRAPLNTVSYRLASLRTGISAGQGLSAGDEVGEGKNFWLQGFGAYVDQSERQGIQGFEASTGGFAFGGDKKTSNTFLIGLVASYSYTDVNSRLSENQTYINSYQGTVYGTYDFGNNYLDAQFGLAYNDYAGRRFISVGAVDRQANADYEGYQFLTKFELGRDLTLPNEFEFTPSLGLSWTHVEINDYTETGASASNLIVNDQDYDILNLSLRGEFRRTWDINQGSLTPEVHLGYNFEAIDDQIQTVAAFTGGGNTFQSTGFDPANHSATGGAGLTCSGNNFDLVATYDFEAKKDFVSHSALLKGRWNF